MMSWLERIPLFWRKKIVSTLIEVENMHSQNEGIQQDAGYVPDSPISDPSMDRLGRWPFAQRVAQTIAVHHDPSSIVVGICGGWGEGKTSVMNLVDRELANHPDVTVVRFNPWRFKDEVHLLQSFF